MTSLRLIRSILLILPIITFLNFNAQALTLQSVRTGEHPDKTRIVFDLDTKSQFKAFTLTSPNRLVLDLPLTRVSSRVSSYKDSTIDNIRVGKLGTNNSRVAIDLKKPAYILSAFTIPKQGNKSDRLVLDIQTAPSNQAAKEKSQGKVFGTLKTSATTFLTNPSPSPSTRPQPRTTTQHKPTPQYKKPTIVIDAGHGGQDPGAIGNHGTFEKKITLAVAKELQKQLLSSGKYNVELTRDSDKYIKLRKRVQIARKHKADLFISLHADSIDKKNVHGASLYTLSEKSSDAQTARLARNENKADLIADIDLSDEGEEVASILIDLAMRDTVNQSRFLANTMASSLKTEGIKTLDTAHRHAGFAVLKAPDIPSVLIEMGFMSNPKEEKMLTQPYYRKKIAGGIKAGIDNYFKKTQENLKL